MIRESHWCWKASMMEYSSENEILFIICSLCRNYPPEPVSLMKCSSLMLLIALAALIILKCMSLDASHALVINILLLQMKSLKQEPLWDFHTLKLVICLRQLQYIHFGIRGSSCCSHFFRYSINSRYWTFWSNNLLLHFN